MKKHSYIQKTNYIIILAIGLIISYFFNYKAQIDLDNELEEYNNSLQNKSLKDLQSINFSLNQLYQQIRFISTIPKVRSIDLYGKNLDNDTKILINRLYQDAIENIELSEIYIISKDMDPEKLDPNTGELETPIIMFDGNLQLNIVRPKSIGKVSTIAEAEQQNEVEIYEYRLHKEQLKYLKEYFPNEESTKKNGLPMIGGHEVLTCDNTEYQNTHIDNDRKGYVFSVPFYNMEGNLSGIISAIIRTKALGKIIPNNYSAIINKTYNNSFITRYNDKEAWQQPSRSHLLNNIDNPEIYFSNMFDLNIPDPRSKWQVKFGYEKEIFYNTDSYVAINKFKIFGYWISAIFIIGGCIINFLLSRIFFNRLISLRLKESQELNLAIGAEKKFAQDIIDSIDHPIFVKNQEHFLITGNNSFKKIFGTDYQSLDTYCSIEDHKLVSTHENTVKEELITTANGNITALISKSVLPLPDGKIGYVGIIHDITKIKSVEEELRQHKNNLQFLVEEKTKELIKAKNEAELANKMKSEFLANMSHELRTPLHAITSFSRHGIERINRWSPEEQVDNLQRISSSGNRLLELLNDLLDLSKLESNANIFDMKECNILSIIYDVSIEVGSLIEDKKLKLILPPKDSNAINIECDKNKIHQLILNLISNAIKFTYEGKEITISYSYDDSSKKLYLNIQDQGIGIPENELEIIFDKFIQSSKTKTGAGGTGLGLAICMEIAKAHHGTIKAQNCPEGGSIFTLTLPIKQQGEAK